MRCWWVKAVARQCNWAPERGLCRLGAPDQATGVVRWLHPAAGRRLLWAHWQRQWARPNSCFCSVTKREKGSSRSRTCRWAANVVEEPHLDWLQSLELCHLLYLLSFLCINVLYFHDPPFLLALSFLLFNFISSYFQLSWPRPSDYFWWALHNQSDYVKSDYQIDIWLKFFLLLLILMCF